MTKDEALHKALKVLNCLNNDRVYETAWVKGAINACEEALEPQIELADTISVEDYQKLREQPTQEPVAWMETYKGEPNNLEFTKAKLDGWSENKEIVPLYTHPKEWQGLSDDEIWNIANFLGKNKEWDYPVMFAKTIEKALKENT